jgi:hypothetical protein
LVVSVLGYLLDRTRDQAQVTLRTDVDSVDVAAERSGRCIRHYNLALEAVNSGFRRLTVTKVFAVADRDSVAELFFARRTSAPGSYSGQRLPTVLRDGERVRIIVDLVGLNQLLKRTLNRPGVFGGLSS